MLVEEVGEVRRLSAAVVEKPAVAVHLGVDALLENTRDARLVELLDQLRAVLTLQAVHGPQRLLEPVKIDPVAG